MKYAVCAALFVVVSEMRGGGPDLEMQLQLQARLSISMSSRNIRGAPL